MPDPDGHHPALRLKGDWLVLAISDGRLRVPHSPGWGLTIEQLRAQTGARFTAIAGAR